MAKYSRAQWIERCTTVHGDVYDYTLVSPSPKSSSKEQIVCKIHGGFSQSMDNHTNGRGCPACGQVSRSSSNHVTADEYIRRSTSTHNDTYDYTQVANSAIGSDLVTIICSTHGAFQQRLVDHSRGSGCRGCAVDTRKHAIQTQVYRSGPKLTQVQYDKLNDKDYMLELYNGSHTTISIAGMLEVSPQTVANYLHEHGIPITTTTSRGEEEIAELLSKYVDVIRNDRCIITPYEIDILVPSHKLAIEYCGLYWHSEQQGKDRHYHANKQRMCAAAGYQLLTIYSDEWEFRNQQIRQKLLHCINEDDRPVVYARKCTIELVSNPATKSKFMEDNHIQGNGPGSLNIALMFESRPVAMISCIIQQSGIILNRYATSERVVGGFSKLVQHLLKSNPNTVVTSFADLRMSSGEMYNKTGWSLVTTIPPDYYYSYPGGVKRLHKFNFRRKNLGRKLTTFDPSKSEWENCRDNGMLRIWDCGKIKYENIHET